MLLHFSENHLAVCGRLHANVDLDSMYRLSMPNFHVLCDVNSIDQSHKSHNASDIYPTMRHFLTEMCTPVHISVTKWCLVGGLWDGYSVGYVRLVYIGHGRLACKIGQVLYTHPTIWPVRSDMHIWLWACCMDHDDPDPSCMTYSAMTVDLCSETADNETADASEPGSIGGLSGDTRLNRECEYVVEHYNEQTRDDTF